jgi:hypothetical protein
MHYALVLSGCRDLPGTHFVFRTIRITHAFASHTARATVLLSHLFDGAGGYSKKLGVRRRVGSSRPPSRFVSFLHRHTSRDRYRNVRRKVGTMRNQRAKRRPTSPSGTTPTHRF